MDDGYRLPDAHEEVLSVALRLESAYHGPEFLFRAERAILVEPVSWIIPHVGSAIAPSALRHPYQVEVLRQLVGL